MEHQVRIDPEPFTIIAAVVGIVSGVATVIDIASKRLHNPQKDQRLIRKNIDQAGDILKLLAADIDIIAEVLDEDGISKERPLELGEEVFLTESQFDRYEESVNRIFERLQQLMKNINKLERLLARQDRAHQSEASKQLRSVRDVLRRTLRDKGQTIAEAMKNVKTTIDQVGALIQETRKL